MESTPKGKRQWGIVLLFILMGVLVIMLAFQLYRHTFSRKRWIAEPEYRRYMLKSLEKRHPLAGMTMEETVALLGNEDSEQSTFKHSGTGTVYPPETTLVYYVGEDGMEDLWLILSFENGVCVSYMVDVA